jgi:hypothetical protein
MFIYTYVFIPIWGLNSEYIYIYIYICIYMYVHIYIYIFIYIHTYIYIYINIYIYIYMLTEQGQNIGSGKYVSPYNLRMFMSCFQLSCCTNACIFVFIAYTTLVGFMRFIQGL